ncbi:hypothetical protein [Flavobacterium restrictum]|uniref:Uncharacterized protein n=1 Tax=Flavobacterium restrictum TaxID=2594428 RepID=A0A553E933_9FLAO|nr:hypothetical protein [Flavobacterium restrictum]TRX41510.1 hypothetical protein FNW21_05280 [Flavobacterium restrictum]
MKKTAKLSPDDILFLEKKAQKKQYTYCLFFAGLFFLVPTLVFFSCENGFCETTLVLFVVNSLFFILGYHYRIGFKNIQKDLENGFKEITVDVIAEIYTLLDIGYKVDAKSYVITGGTLFNIGEKVKTESTPLSKIGLRLEKIV